MCSPSTRHILHPPTGNSKHETNREKKVTKVDVQLWAEQLSVAQHEVTKVDVQLLAEQDGECAAMGLEPHPIAGVQCVPNSQRPPLKRVKLGSQEHSQEIADAQSRLVANKAACKRKADAVLASAMKKTKVLQDLNEEQCGDVFDWDLSDRSDALKQKLLMKDPQLFQVKQPNFQQGGGSSSNKVFTVAPMHARTPPAYAYSKRCSGVEKTAQ